MPEIIETMVYQITELSEQARDRAREWYRQDALDCEWWEFAYDDFERICDILGVELRTRSVRLLGGGLRSIPCIRFSGFWSQGDGACFEGQYSYAKGSSTAIRAYAPKDEELHRIADVLADIQRRNFFRLSARASHRGRYCHEYSMEISVERESGGSQVMTGDAEDGVTEALRDLARWLYGRLEEEYEGLTSDEAIDEVIAANAYGFTADGERFG